ncbi:MAG: HAD family phosphatase [Planctomycetota bacterium]|nr:MAG: HAD family phosphatase [Planctomycetota bacterium]
MGDEAALMLAQPRLLALDLDGTLLDEHSMLPKEHEELVHWVRQQGIEVAIVTGRPLLTTRWVWERLQLDTPVVCFNGVWVGVPGEAPLACEALHEHEVHDIISVLGELDGSICVYPGVERWLIHRFTNRTRDFSRLYGVTIEENPDILRTWQGDSCKVMFVSEPDRLQAALRQARDHFADRYHVVASQQDRFEIHRPGITKAWGLAQLAQLMGIEQASVWAVGDAANDTEMLEWAAMGCAMGHAPQTLRDCADVTLPSIHEYGLQALRPLLQTALTEKS